MPSSKTTEKSSKTLSGPGVSRRDFVKGAAAGGPALTGTMSRAFAQAGDVIKIGFVSPRTGALGGFGETDRYVLDLARKALAGGLDGRRQDIRGRDPRPGHPVRSVARRPARQGADQQRQGRPDAGDVDAGDDQSRSPTPARPRACPACRPSCRGRPGISAAAPSRARPRRSNGPITSASASQEFSKCLYLAMERPGDDQQEGRRALSQRRRRQRHPRPSRAAARQGRLHHRRSRRATRTARPTIRRRSPSSRRRNARSSTPSRSRRTSPRSGVRRRSRATPRWSRSPRSPRPGLFPSTIEALGSLGYNIASACYWHTTFPYKSPLTGMTGAGARRRLREEHPASNGTSNSARRSRCSTPASRR